MIQSKPPQVALWLSVPDTCRMRGDFEVGDHGVPDVHVILGDNGDDTHLLFEREALARFVELARRMLAVPQPRAALPAVVLESDYGHDIREIGPGRRGEAGDDSAAQRLVVDNPSNTGTVR